MRWFTAGHMYTLDSRAPQQFLTPVDVDIVRQIEKKALTPEKKKLALRAGKTWVMFLFWTTGASPVYGESTSYYYFLHPEGVFRYVLGNTSQCHLVSKHDWDNPGWD